MKHSKYILILLLVLSIVSPASAAQEQEAAIRPVEPEEAADRIVIENMEAGTTDKTVVQEDAAVARPPEAADRIVRKETGTITAPGNPVPEEAQKTDVVENPDGVSTKKRMDYQIGPGDQLDISVWRDDALTKSLIVLPDGKISFPLIGQVAAAGKTVAQLKQEIEEKIAPYVPDPVVNVEAKQTNSMLIYVIGRVNSPGRFAVNTYVNVLQALSIAGGLNPFAKRNKIKVLRNDGVKTEIFYFRYDDVTDGEDLEQNIQIKNGDVIVVP